jgi:hypothetical protein
MFDTVRAQRDGQDIEVQVKVYMGRYRPGCEFYEAGQPIPDPDFPKVRFAEWGYADSGDCIVEFDGGRVVGIIWPPETKDYQFPELPRTRRHPERRAAICKEEQRRIGVKYAGMSPEESLGKVFAEFITDTIGRPGFARLLFTKGNYAKIGGRWERIRPIWQGECLCRKRSATRFSM